MVPGQQSIDWRCTKGVTTCRFVYSLLFGTHMLNFYHCVNSDPLSMAKATKLTKKKQTQHTICEIPVGLAPTSGSDATSSPEFK